MLSHILENQCRVLRSFKEEKQPETQPHRAELFSLSFMLKTLTLAESLVYERVCSNTPCWLLAQLKVAKPNQTAPLELSKQSTPPSSQHQE
ncbi:hypothetical protein [Thioflexithrix psekupsensis]|uniref:hypothetical protein n=1 Tax=Thioflexithrix psekupsensis TaxID=1570016 RepID=UPI00111F973C|nr:hypothetical protein [Thioflexithrix psekupsensis]